jgi:hypothetical protein
VAGTVREWRETGGEDGCIRSGGLSAVEALNDARNSLSREKQRSTGRGTMARGMKRRSSGEL